MKAANVAEINRKKVRGSNETPLRVVSKVPIYIHIHTLHTYTYVYLYVHNINTMHGVPMHTCEHVTHREDAVHVHGHAIASMRLRRSN